MINKGQYTVAILDNELTIRTEDDETTVAEVVEYVNQKIHEIQSRAGAIDGIRIGILSALNIAEEYIRLKKEHEELKKRVEETSREILDLFENA